MKSSSIRYKYKFKNKLTLYFSEYKIVMLISALMVVLGVALGVYTAIKYSGELALDNLSDTGLIDFLKGDKGTMGLFFPYLFSFSLYFVIVITTNVKPICCLLTYLLLIIKGYLIGFDITVLIVLYNFAGIINAIIIIMPCELIVCLVLVIVSAIAVKRNFNCKKFGNSTCCKTVGFNYTKAYCLLMFFAVLALLIKCLLMPLIRVTIIVN